MRIQRFTFVLFFILVFCTSAIADDWGKYSEFMDRYYFLDKQPFVKISCKVKLSSLDATRKQLSTLTNSSGAIKVTEDFDNFSITMDRDRNIEFVKPTLDIEIVSEEGIKDPEKARAGIEYMKTGFQMQIDGAVSMLEELLKNVYFSPRKDEYSNLIFKMDKQSDTAKASYKKDNLNVAEVYKGALLTQTETSQNAKANGKVHFQKVNGKLMMDKADINVSQQNAEINTVFSVDYQKIGAIFLPVKINAKSKTRIPGQNANFEGDFNIILTDCKIE